ncbi:hypothetical protein ACFS27_24305 [Promicromonospora vindobonensis]|uniref:Ribbon-helix-helix CopG family protein n=1 Tax=Promicromonospora vindobonensis TaxID=195748 RepID=A0ABW5W2A8_9MICO
MADRNACSRVELDGRRIVVDLSDADLARLTATALGRGVDGTRLVHEWIRRGLRGDDAWAPPDERPGRANRVDRVNRDIEVAQQSESLFTDLLGGPYDPG